MNPSPAVEPRRVSAQIVHTRESFSGPIPPPAVLAEFDRIVPGAAERILAMAERDQKHTQVTEASVVQFMGAERRRGQKLAFAGLVLMLLVVAYALHLGHTTAAGVLGGSSLVAIVAVFITGRLASPNRSSDPKGLQGKD